MCVHDMSVVQVFWYVDDFLVLFEAMPQSTSKCMDELSGVSVLKPLELTKEVLKTDSAFSGPTAAMPSLSHMLEERT